MSGDRALRMLQAQYWEKGPGCWSIANCVQRGLPCLRPGGETGQGQLGLCRHTSTGFGFAPKYSGKLFRSVKERGD